LPTNNDDDEDALGNAEEDPSPTEEEQLEEVEARMDRMFSSAFGSPFSNASIASYNIAAGSVLPIL